MDIPVLFNIDKKFLFDRQRIRGSALVCQGSFSKKCGRRL
jgi:hypothetical protein